MTCTFRNAALACAALAVLVAAPAAAFCFGTIRVHVFVDLNGNGVLDAGEPPQPGITVRFDQANVNGTVHETFVTDANGNADFYTPVAVTYNVTVVAPSGSTQIATLAQGSGYQCNVTTYLSFGLSQGTAVPAISHTAMAILLLVLSAAGAFAIPR